MADEDNIENQIALYFLNQEYPHMPLKTIKDFETWSITKVERIRQAVRAAYHAGWNAYKEVKERQEGD